MVETISITAPCPCSTVTDAASILHGTRKRSRATLASTPRASSPVTVMAKSPPHLPRPLLLVDRFMASCGEGRFDTPAGLSRLHTLKSLNHFGVFLRRKKLPEVQRHGGRQLLWKIVRIKIIVKD